MALSKTHSVFGIHSFSPYSYTTGMFYGTLKCLAGSEFSISGETIPLQGGSLPYSWDVKEGRSTASLVIKPRQYEPFMFTLFLGKAPTETTADTGAVTTLSNYKGTSAMSATIGVASVGVKSGSEADLKFGKYVVYVVSATTVDVYAASDIDFERGTNLTFVNDSLKITSAPLTITTSTAVQVPSLGVELTGGSGTIGMTIGDSAYFIISPASTRGFSVKIGGIAERTPVFGAFMTSEALGDGEMFSIECYKVKSAMSLPLMLNEKAWSEAEINCEAFYDTTQDAICQIRSITPTLFAD